MLYHRIAWRVAWRRRRRARQNGVGVLLTWRRALARRRLRVRMAVIYVTLSNVVTADALVIAA